MTRVNVLDCTLRDGGYENLWEFGYGNICGIVENLMATNTEYIEIGFLQNDSKGQDSTIFSSCMQMMPLLKNRTRKIAIMMKNGDYEISRLEEKSEVGVDLIRISFHKDEMIDALGNMKMIKSKGYQVSCNPINIVGYTREELIKLISEVNKVNPNIFYIVDTFGALMPGDFKNILSIINQYMDSSIKVGIHLHNNLMMSFPLAILFLEWVREKRECFIDSCVGGIGRAPGNLPTELIMEYINKQYDGNYFIDPIYEVIDKYVATVSDIQIIKKRIAYQLSAKYCVHRNYSEFYLDMKGVGLTDINKYLSRISNEKKDIFDKQYAEMVKNSIELRT